jgi:hypothetical protein
MKKEPYRAIPVGITSCIMVGTIRIKKKKWGIPVYVVKFDGAARERRPVYSRFLDVP